jgi:ribosomal protein L29
MKRLVELERLLGEYLSVPEPPRKRLTKKDIAAMAAEGFLEYLVDRVDTNDAPDADKLLEEFRGMSDEKLAESILTSIEKLLVDHHPRGQRIFRFLRNRAPGRLGRAYAILRLFQDTRWVLEDLEEDYEYYRRNS